MSAGVVFGEVFFVDDRLDKCRTVAMTNGKVLNLGAKIEFWDSTDALDKKITFGV